MPSNSDQITDAELAEWKALIAAFQPPEWEIMHLGDDHYFRCGEKSDQTYPAYDIKGLQSLGDYECGAMEKPAADFVVATKDAMPRLIAEVELLRGLLRVSGMDV